MNKYDKRNVFDVYQMIEHAVENAKPLSVIRLGDREGGMLAYPDLLGRSAVDRCVKDWFGHTDISDEQACFIAQRMRDAVRKADIVGLPRNKQAELHPHYQAVFDAAGYYTLFSEHTVFTDAALHRYLQFTLLFRKLLKDRDFVGVISPRDVNQQFVEQFGVQQVVQYPVRGQSKYEGPSETPHYPDRFFELKESLSVPYPGAIFLVGAGGLGKIYCHWLKARGAVAIDIGAIFDAWTDVKSRLVHPCHSFSCYSDMPLITTAAAIDRFNELCDHFGIDTERLSDTDATFLAGQAW